MLNCFISVENGETEMSPEESWEHKEEISEAEPDGGSLGDGRPTEESLPCPSPTPGACSRSCPGGQ